MCYGVPLNMNDHHRISRPRFRSLLIVAALVSVGCASQPVSVRPTLSLLVPPVPAEQETRPRDLGEVAFDFTTATLGGKDKEMLRTVAEVIKADPDRQVRIEGYADDLGGDVEDYVLGLSRAEAAWAYLVGLGAEASRLTTDSYGRERRRCLEPTDACRRTNRRARLFLVAAPGPLSGPAVSPQASSAGVTPAVRASEPPDDPDRAYLELGFLLFQEGRDREALEQFRRYRIGRPADPVPLYYMGLVAARARESAQAEVLFRETLVLDRDFIPARLALSTLAYNAGRYAAALAQLESLTAAHPDSAEALFQLSATWLALNEPAKAEAAALRLHAVDPVLAEAARGIWLYHRGRYEAALLGLSRTDGPDALRGLSYYYQGLSRYHLGQFDRVSPLMLRAKTLEQGLAPGALYYSGLAYYREGQLVEAREDLQPLTVMAQGTPLGLSAQRFVDTITKFERFGRPWDVSLGIVPQYDTNVISQPNDKPLAADISRQNDSAVAAQLVGAVRPYRTARWTVTARYTGLALFYQTLTKNNVQGHEVALSTDYKRAPAQWRLAYSFGYTIQGPTPFSIAHTVAPALTLAVAKWLIVAVQTQAKFQDMIESKNDDRDGTNLLAGLTPHVLLFQGRGNIRAGYTYDRDTTKSPVWEYQGQKGSMGFAFPLPLGFSGDLSGEYYLKAYQGITPGQTVRREDATSTGSALLARSVTRQANANLRYAYIRNLSNFSDYDYSRQLITLTLQWKF